MIKKAGLGFFGCFLSVFGAFAQTNTVFEADFESGTIATTGTITYTAGYNVQVPVTSGPDATLGSNALFADPSTGGSAATDITLTPTGAVSLSGSDSARVSLDFVIRRTNGSTKSHYVTGYDSGDNIIFRFVLGELNEFGNGGSDRQRPGYADENGAASFAGKIASGTTPGNYWFGNDGSTADGLNPAKEAHFDITVNSSGWSVYTLKLDGTTFAQTTTLPTWDGGTYTELAYVKVTGESASAGGYFDNLMIQSITGPEPVSNSHDFYYNLAKYQSVTADSSASDKPAKFANDGFVSQDNRWVSSGAAPHWLQIELAAPMTIGSAHLYSGGTWNSPMSDFVLQYDNGGSWVDIGGTDVSGNTLPELNLSFDTPVTAQSFRLYTTDGTARVEELTLYPPTTDGSDVAFGVDVDLNIAKLRQYDYSSVFGANYPKLAIDGYADDTSAWASTNAAGPHDLEIHVPQGEAVGGIQLYSGWEDSAGSQIENFEVAYYDSGTSNWVNFAGGSVSNNTEQDLNLWFDTAATSTKFRFRSLDAAQTVIRELVLLPDNQNGGYPLWTDVLDEAPPSNHFMEYEDDYYTIENRDTGLNLTTAMNGSTITTNEPWFQVLFNFGTDTFRLRSKETELCFEVANASTNAGAAIVEGTYSSAPHQRWRLENTGYGEHFKIVNAWSGLVLGLDGTNVVQVADGDEFSKQWKINYETHFPKQGQASHFHFSHMFKPSWAYRWTYVDEEDLGTGQYMPMQWGGIGSTTPGILKYQPTWYQRANQTTLMGFNEPDLHDQANMEVETAAYQWARMERFRLPLLGPCPAGYKNYWRTGYEEIAAKEGLRSEYMAMHWYSTAGASSGSPGTLISNMEYLYNLYGKPIWLTEFSTRNFNGTMTSWSRNHNYNFLAEFMWRAETLPWLKKWSLFEWGYGGDSDTTDANSENPTDMNSPKLALHYSNDSSDPGWEDLMECGLLLAGWDGNTNTVDETAYIIHNKGRYLRLIDHPASNSVTTADVEHRTATEQFMLEAAPNGNKYITGLSDGRRLSCDGSSVDLAAAGTTGTAVEWTLTDYQYGWYYIDHPSTGKRLRISNSDEVDVVADTTANNNVRFRFIKHYLPITLTEVQSLPYSESFENGVGAWREFDTEYNNGAARFWEVGSGGTPTAAAGPSGASAGDCYLFAEGHDAGSYVTNSVQCVFDMSAETSTSMTFDYHMYGTYIDFLAVDIHDGTSWTSNVWKKSGAQHSSSSEAWKTASVNLTGYTGNSEVTIRFRTANKQWSAADPAIDNIEIGVAAQTLPYAESFESGFGAWTQSADDDLDWTRNSGGTPDSNTGPGGASDGDWYLYVENHDSGMQYKTASLECTFDLSTVSDAELGFDYHMYGPYIDYLAVDVFDGSSWVSNVWKKTGQQQASSEVAWSNAVVSLTDYAGLEDVIIRFRSKQGEWHAADTAIDNIWLEEPYVSPYEQWAENAFTNAPVGTDTSAGGNPDGDANSNELEWLLGTDPLTADSPITSMEFDDTYLTLLYTRRVVEDVSVYTEVATSLVPPDWGTAEIVYEGTISSDGEIETVAVLVLNDADLRYIRIQVEQ